ncbi:MAG TPA: cyanase [Polyangiales bacterium]|nr:cyanase [Polyangiales bacterium]
MHRTSLSQTLLEAKQRKGLTWTDFSKAVGMSEVWLASVCYGESAATQEIAEKICNTLDLGEPIAKALTEYPVRGNSIGDKPIPTDPLLYRFYEILAVYGLSLKDVIQEKFGEGIMSAIDFTMDVQKQTDPKGDRVVITMNGKFLPYKRW